MNLFPIIVGPILASLLLHSQIEYNNGWRGLKALESTKEQVEKLLGAPNNGPEGAYSLEEATINFTYSSGHCKENWNVPKDTVIRIVVSLKKNRPKLSDLNLSLSKYKMRVDRELPDVRYYTKLSDGVTLVVIGDEVKQVLYYPSENNENLKCNK
ncbi:MAG: hypothetical protein ACREEM_25510 [Blastocatellia bacterium]